MPRPVILDASISGRLAQVVGDGRNIFGLGGRVFLEADIPTRLSPAAEIEGERHEAALGHLAGVEARHLLLDRCPGTGD
jgi:hypothetical protein